MKLGVIGCGKMGGALVEGIIKANLCSADDVIVFDAYPKAAESLRTSLGVTVASSNADVVATSEVTLLCVKPQGLGEMLKEIGESENRLLISIAAGVKISAIEAGVKHRHRVIRVMPNTPSLIAKGASAFALGSSATDSDAAITESLLSAVGYTCRVDESHLDAVTALSGSGPAYIFLMIESLIAGGVEHGLPADIARNLALHTVSGAAELVIKTGDDPALLRENVTSPNGTTFAALESFRSEDFEGTIRRAIAAAAERSRELGAS
jgi:pyrroline-5-carboxylate reductase